MDDFLRGALRLMKTLTRRGTSSIPNAENVKPNTNTSVELELAAPLVVWVKDDQDLDAYGASDPHIICRNGEYFVYLAAGVVFACGGDSVQCLDTFFKAFSVFNIKVPTKLIKISDFLDVFVFKVKSYTTRVGVRQLVAEFQEVENAENSVQDINS
uniref:(northern house mosquito) hypothetical protein n=2 Tax=Culex pipiens TaxID=7175 RepID=A0A8D8I9T8_CULPI